MLSLLAPLLLATSITLEGSTDALELVTSAAGSVDYQVSWSNVTATALTTPGTSVGNITTATTTTLVSAPSASNWRHLRGITIRNASTTAANTITVQVDRSANNRTLYQASLGPGQTAQWREGGGWERIGANGSLILQSDPAGYSSLVFAWSKVATALDAAGYHYLANKDTGFPGAWSVGTPGTNGVATDCSAVGTAGSGGALSTGSHVLPNAATGSWYLTRFGLNGVVANTYQLVDLLWYNTGLTVTTTTAQNITTPTFPARDLNGSSNGEGYQIALYALTALGNAGTVANSTVSYTNSAGTAGRTATFSGSVGFQAPATPVIGTWMPFQLQAGDTGVKSIENITLNTTYTSGTMMLVVFRPIALEGVSTANFPSGSLLLRQAVNPGVKIFNGTCFGIAVLGAPATTAPSFTAGIVELMER